MSTTDTCCTIVPYFEVPTENLAAFKALCDKLRAPLAALKARFFVLECGFRN